MVAAALYISQFFYFDTYTNQFSFEGVGPIFRGHLSENLRSVILRPFTLRADTKDIVLEPEQLRAWIEPYHRTFTNRVEYRVVKPQVASDLSEFAAGLAIPPINAHFGEIDGQMAEIEPAKFGQRLDLSASQENIVQALIHNISSASLALESVEPEINMEKLQGMGITALIGEGTSNFGGSPASRVHNINVGALKMDNILLSPGASFSFVDQLGDVDASTGYKPELVIKDGKIIPEYGGGLCQVSTTMFRAAIYAGLRIDERRPHSIPVRYYNPQGFDATIYPGSADLKFTNDTLAPILIQSRVEGSIITFSVFGSPDGRTVKVDGPYTYESNPDGSLKTVFYRTITYPPPPKGSGETSKETYSSAYKSPALFQVIKNPLE